MSRKDLTPISGSNFASRFPVRDRWAVQFTPLKELCCGLDEAEINFNLKTNDSKKYYVLTDNLGFPVNNSLVPYKQGMNLSQYQQVFAVTCCPQLQPATINSITAGNTTASIAFTNSVGATTNQWEISTSPAFTSPITSTDFSTPLPLTGLVNGTLYYVRVRSTDGTNTSPWSPTETFRPVVGTLSAPFSLMATPGDSSASLAYSNDVNSTNQVIELSLTNTFTTIAATFNDAVSPAALTGLTNGQLYYVRAKSTAPTYADSPWSSIISFTPAAVVLSVYYGNKGTGTNLNQAQIEAGTPLAYSPGADISVPFFTSAPTFHWAAWPSSETGITNYFVNFLDFGGFGGGSPWNALTTVGSYTFVINQYATQYPSPDPVQFRH